MIQSDTKEKTGGYPAVNPGTLIVICCLLLPRQTEPLPIQTDHIPVGTWVYTVSSGGSRLGELTSVIRRENDMIYSTSDLRGSQIQRGSLSVIADQLTPIESSTFIYQPGKGSTTARVTYSVQGDSLMVSGSVIWSGIGQPRSTPVMIHQIISKEGRFDNQCVDLLIASLPLESGGSWRASLFDPTHHKPVPITISVKGRTTASTEAGSFEVWSVEVEGVSGRVEYLIECTTRVLISQYIHSKDLRLELKSLLRPQ